MVRMMNSKLYILVTLTIISVFILGSGESVCGTANTVNHTVPAVAAEIRITSRTTIDAQNELMEPGLSGAAYTTPLAFALRQSAIQKVRASKTF